MLENIFSPITKYVTAPIGRLFVPVHGQTLWGAIIGGLLVGLLVLFVLTKFPPKYRKWTVIGVTFLAGLFYALEYLLPGDPNTGENFLTKYIQPLGGDWIPIVGAFALGLGTLNLMRIHGKAITRRRSGWINSLAFYIALVSMAVVGVAKTYIPTTATGSRSIFTVIYGILFTGMLAPLGATMFSIIAFYIVSAAYRAFRIRSFESILMMAAAFLVMLGPVPVTQLLTANIPTDGWTSVFRIEHISYWIMTVPNTAAQRGMGFGIGVGALAMALRIWLSLERGSYFDKQL